MHFEIIPLLAAATDNTPSVLDSGIDAIQQVVGPFGVKPTLLIAQIINFAIVAFVVYQFGIKAVLVTMDERNKKIADGLKYTDERKKKLADTEVQQMEVLKQASLEGKKVITEARDTAKALAEKVAQDATRQAEDTLKKGQAAIALERQQMLNDLRREVATLVVSTTHRVLDRDLTPEERARYNASAAQDMSKN
jgi:F-type H+-transporting ATPase subunit b